MLYFSFYLQKSNNLKIIYVTFSKGYHVDLSSVFFLARLSREFRIANIYKVNNFSIYPCNVQCSVNVTCCRFVL